MPAHSDDELQFRLLVQGTREYAIYMVDPHGYVISWNDGAERMKGFRSAEIIGRHFSCFYGEEDRAAGVPDLNLAACRDTGHFEANSWRYREDGSRFWASVAMDAIHRDEKLIGFAKITRDCTEQMRQAETLEALSANLQLILSVLPYGACLLDEARNIVLCNPALGELFGVPLETVSTGSDLVQFILARTDPFSHEALVEFSGYLNDSTLWHNAYELVLHDRHLSVIVRRSGAHGVVVAFQDVTQRVLREIAVQHRAEHDALTGLFNRYALGNHVEKLLGQSGTAEKFSIFYLDLNKFKTINDTFGHIAGDAVLKETARRIIRATRPGDFVCRLGGDEFMIVPAGSLTFKQSEKMASRLCKHIGKSFVIADGKLDISASIGIASCSHAGMTMDELIGNADIALFKAKQSGGGWCVYNAETGLSILKRRATELRLRAALSNKEFTLHWQPISSTNGGHVKGFEALIRWTQSSGGVVPPGEFIPLAEELGLMTEIGSWVLETACCEAASWPSHLTVAVNVSATQMKDDKFIERVTSALEKSGLAAHRLEIEITETAMIISHEKALLLLTHLREMGVLIAIDDFGTGYSSLSFLQTLPFTRIKIDRSFVSDIATNTHSMAIVKAVMRMSQELGLSVTAEGVETEEQRAILANEACQEIQGYLVSKPMDAEHMQAFLDVNYGKTKRRVN